MSEYIGSVAGFVDAVCRCTPLTRLSSDRASPYFPKATFGKCPMDERLRVWTRGSYDTRYIGTLHEIDSASSTVALEHVRSYGTEGRCAKPEDEVPASDTVYEYIVFKGSDVKDLTILDPLTENDPPPQVPNDPAILGVSLNLFLHYRSPIVRWVLETFPDEAYRM